MAFSDIERLLGVWNVLFFPSIRITTNYTLPVVLITHLWNHEQFHLTFGLCYIGKEKLYNVDVAQILDSWYFSGLTQIFPWCLLISDFTLNFFASEMPTHYSLWTLLKRCIFRKKESCHMLTAHLLWHQLSEGGVRVHLIKFTGHNYGGRGRAPDSINMMEILRRWSITHNLPFGLSGCCEICWR